MAEVFKGRNQDRKEFKVVGQMGISGRQSYAIATGLAKYPRDIVIPNMLYAKVLRSPYAHARIKSMDISKAKALQGVNAVVTWEDPEIKAMPSLPAWNWFSGGSGATPILSNTADREGDEVGVIVAAETEELCDQALRLIADSIQWEVLPFVLDAKEALKPDAPILNPDLNPKTNLFGENNYEVGNVEAGFKTADQILEFDLTWESVCQHRPNPTTVVAYWEKDPTGSEGETLFIDTPMHIQGCGPQSTAIVTQDLPLDKVHVLTPYWGGKYCGFVAKRGEAYAPLLAKRTGRPVRYVENRRDDFDIGWAKNTPHVKIGFKNDGTLVAAHGQMVANIGVRSSTANEYLGSMTPFQSTKCPNIKQEMKYVFTSTFKNRTFQGAAGYDILGKAFYLIADKLGMDPTEVALKNCHTPEPSLKECITKGKAAIGWQWHATGAKKLTNGKMHGYGFRYHHCAHSGQPTYHIATTLRQDGKIYMPHSEALVGTHWEDAMAMVIAEEMGAKIEDVIVHFVPNLPMWLAGSAMDRGPSATWAAKEAAIDLKAKLLTAAATSLKLKPEELDTKDSMVYVRADPSKTYPFKKFANIQHTPLAANFIGKPVVPSLPKTLNALNSLFCEVGVDTETGEVEITKWVAACDGGKIIRPASFEGQTEQVLIFNTEWAKGAEYIWDPATGVKLNASTLEYKPATILDIPPIVNVNVETRTGAGCYGAVAHTHEIADRGIIGLAVYNAIGKWIDNPITPAKVLAALGKI